MPIYIYRCENPECSEKGIDVDILMSMTEFSKVQFEGMLCPVCNKPMSNVIGGRTGIRFKSNGRVTDHLGRTI